TGDAGPVEIGDSVSYTIAVTNTGNVTLHNVTITDAKLGLSETLATLAVGATATYSETYGPVTEGDLPGPIVNTATADADETGEVEASHSVEVLDPVIDLSLEITASDTTPPLGETIVLTLVVENDPNVFRALDVQVKHVLGAGLEFVSAVGDRGTYDATSGLWSIGTIQPGESVTLDVLVRTLPGGPFDSSAEVVAARHRDVDSIPANASVAHEDDDDQVVLTPRWADLAVTKTASAPTVSYGDPVTFSVEVTNLGPYDVDGVILSDAMPLGLSYVSSHGDGAFDPISGQWSIGAIPVGGTASLSLVALVVDAAIGQTLENVALLVARDLPDPNPSNDRATATVVVPGADLELGKSVDDPTPAPGDEVTFTLTLSNLGPDAALGIWVRDVLPPGLRYVAHQGQGVFDAALGSWNVGGLVVGASASLAITALVEDSAAGSRIVNAADVVLSSLPDPDPSNNHAEDDVTVEESDGGGGGALTGCAGRVVIHEVAWAGTAANPDHEWIELRNVGTEPVDLSGWSLRWRRKVPVSPEDYEWHVVPLAGILAGGTECVSSTREADTDVIFARRDEDTVSWAVQGLPRTEISNYLLLERLTDDAVSSLDADIVYDTVSPYPLELFDDGAVIELRDAHGTLVDSANAYPLNQPGWVAGDVGTRASMERTNPLLPDQPDNWHTNIGIVTAGRDATERPLVATARAENSTSLAERTLSAVELTASVVRQGDKVEVRLDLTTADRRSTGWPWVYASRPTLDVAGGGASLAEPSDYAFVGKSAGEDYWLTIDTVGLAAGKHLVWVVYGEGQAIIVPIDVVP
ncbi:MAG: lamin tail domain-containing protein, partial [Candidatus Bipolaricaulota bacterium]